jgi:hypothetical protein
VPSYEPQRTQVSTAVSAGMRNTKSEWLAKENQRPNSNQETGISTINL